MGRQTFLLLLLPVLATLTGGLLAIRYQRFRAVLIALGAGLLLGATFLDLLPEALSLGAEARMPAAEVLGLTLLCFLFFLLFEAMLDGVRWDALRGGDGVRGQGSKRTSGRVAGGLLIFHSFRDGMAIGASFAASHPAGFAVMAGVVAHDFGDGMNTVLLTTAGERPRLSDYLFLAADAIAPFLGGMLTVWWLLSSRYAAMLLALAAGFFLQMATSDFLPQLRGEAARRRLLTLSVLAGAAIIYAANVLMSRQGR